MKLTTTALLTLSTALMGCAIVHRPYAPPTTDNVSYFRVVGGSGLDIAEDYASVATFEEGDTCRRRYFLVAKEDFIFTPKIAMPKAEETSVSFVKIAANKSFSFVVYRDIRPFRACIPFGNFTPVAGLYYTARYTEGYDSCYLSLESSTVWFTSNPRRERLRRMVYTTALDEDSSFCRPAPSE